VWCVDVDLATLDGLNMMTDLAESANPDRLVFAEVAFRLVDSQVQAKQVVKHADLSLARHAPLFPQTG